MSSCRMQIWQWTRINHQEQITYMLNYLKRVDMTCINTFISKLSGLVKNKCCPWMEKQQCMPYTQQERSLAMQKWQRNIYCEFYMQCLVKYFICLPSTLCGNGIRRTLDHLSSGKFDTWPDLLPLKNIRKDTWIQ